jgi:predicted membrane protein DUF2142
MRRSHIRAQTVSVRLSRDRNTETPRWYVFWSGLALVWSRLESRPAFVFIVFSFAFGSAISVVVPPLRGPDEIAHFLRIYSYTRGVFLPTTEVDGRKGIFVERELHTQLSFFKDAGERFFRNKEQGLRYGEIMKEYPHPGPALDEQEQATKFMPFAGTEGYHPVAYAPYILAAAIGNLLKLDFPNLLLLMRLLGLITFTAVAAYAIKLTPTLKWAFVLIAMLPVAIYNRSVLSADGAALAYALVITALCFSAVQRHGRVWERSLWMEQPSAHRGPQFHFITAMGASSVRRHRGVAPSSGRNLPTRVFRSAVEARVHVGAPPALPVGNMDVGDCMGRPAMAGAYWHFGVAGCLASDLDLFRAHGHSPPRPLAKTEFGWSGACTCGSHHGRCCRGLHRDRVSDLLSHLYAGHHRSRPRRPRTILRHCFANRGYLPRLINKRQFTPRCARDGNGRWIISFGNYEFQGIAGSTLVDALNSSAVARRTTAAER